MKAVDLFCGAGGFSKGATDAGVDVVAAFDHWDKAVAVYNENHEHEAHLLDLSSMKNTVRAVAPYRPELIFGGPPCQDFSTAGMKIEGKRANLVLSFAESAITLSAKYVLMENVPNIINSKTWPKALRLFHDAGYFLWHRLIDASLCGVPQMRKRIFLLAWKGDPNLSARLDSWIDANLEDHPLVPKKYMNGLTLPKHYYVCKVYKTRSILSINEPAHTISTRNEPMPSGFLDDYWHPTMRNGYPGHPSNPIRLDTTRSLTEYERAYLQTFPLNWKWGEVAKSNMRIMIGNAVPPIMAKFVFSGLLFAIAPEVVPARYQYSLPIDHHPDL